MGCGRSNSASRLPVLLCLALFSWIPVSCAPGESDVSEPGVERIVLVTLDTLRADHVGCYGAEGAETPTLDAFAAEGVRFATAIAPTPVTLPSHASLLTGRDPPRHGVRHNGFFQLGEEIPTLAEQLGAAGFATAAFVSAFVLDGRYGLARGFERYDDNLGVTAAAGGLGIVAERRGDHTVDAVLGWLADAPERFFLWVHLYDPHANYNPPSPYAERFQGRPYDGEIAFADAQLGRLRDAVEERWPGGTLWWVTSDHGESLGEHDESTHSFTLYDATQHVPMLAAGPGLPTGHVFDPLVAHSDVAPTLLELAGLPPLPDTDGVSLARSLQGQETHGRESAWVETLATQLDLGWSPLLGVRTATHKYVRAPEPELYDLRADPGELENRIESEPGLAAELDGLVEQRVRAGLPVQLGAAPSQAERAQLEALGYLRGGESAASELPLGEVGGFDPKRGVAEIERIDELQELLAKRRGKEALALYDQIESRGYVMLMFGSAAAGQAGDHARAEQEARRALAIMERSEPWITIGGAQLIRGQSEEARRSFERAAELDPEGPGPLVAFGLLAEGAGDREGALRWYAKAQAVPVPSSAAFWRAAALAIEDKRIVQAREFLTHVPQSDLRLPLAARRLANAERRAGRTELARTRVEGALREYPWDVPLWMLKAELLDQAGDLEGALVARREALSLAPDQPDTQNAVAWTLGRLGRDLAEAEQHIETAIASLGRKPPLLDTFATVRVAEGRHAEALELTGEGLEAAKGNTRVDLLFRRAEALAGLGRLEEAKRTLDDAIAASEESDTSSSSWEESERRVLGQLAAGTESS